MSRLPLILGSGVAIAYLWKRGNSTHSPNVSQPLAALSGLRNAKRTKERSDLVPVVSHWRSWPGTRQR